jgi:hypothetical protein|tara:strand:- start:1134 stop:1337 length:204 start_codon:yes stop_codon:yes gene_type:complete
MTHIRREIDEILDQINEIITTSEMQGGMDDEDKAMIEHLERTINLKTDNGKRAKGMWTESPEFNYIK